MQNYVRSWRWSIIAPLALLAMALAAVLGFDLAHTGEAKPPPLVGAIGSPVRGMLVPATATPKGLQPTAAPRATVPAGVAGTPADRDVARRKGLLTAIGGFLQLKARDGTFPTTDGHIQTLCAYTDLDVGCKLKDVLNQVPADPLGAPLQNGYWYESDGTYVKLYAALEQDIPDSGKCPTDNVDLKKKANLICVTAP